MNRILSATAFLTLMSTSAFASSPAEIFAANRAAMGGSAWDGKQTAVIHIVLSGQGLSGTADSTTDLSNGYYVDRFTLGPASGAQGFDGKVAWSQDPSGTVKAQEGGDARQLAVNEAYRRANMWWRPGFAGAAITDGGTKTDGGLTYDVLTVAPQGGKPFAAWFDTKTHLLERVVERQGADTITTTLSGYKAFEGVEFAGKQIVDSGHGEKYVQTALLTKAQFGPAQSPAAFAIPKVTVHDFSLPQGMTQTTFPFQLMNNHLYADVTVNGRGPLQFIFDTGGHNIVVPEEAKALGLKVEGAMPGGGVGDKVADYGLTRVASLKVGDATFTNQIFGVLTFEAPGVEGTTINGMVGFEVFKRFVTRIDYSKHTMTLIDPAHFDPKNAGTAVPFVFNGDLPNVKGSFEGIPASFDIDTGARDELTLTQPFAEAHGLTAKHPKGVNAVEGWGVGGPSRGYVTRGSELVLGAVKIPGVVTSFSTQKKGAFSDASYQGNVGGGLLKRFVVTFDYDHQIMYLKPLPAPVADTGTFDRAGMWINAVPEGFKIVDVTATGPADAAGLQADDVITAVNGTPATNIPVYEMRRRLRSDAPGTVERFSILRAGARHDVNVTLRDLI